MQVIKSNGEAEPFNPEKIRKSLMRAGADSVVIEQVIEEARKKIN